METNPSSKRLLWGRLLIGIVTFVNIQCAIAFFIHPEKYEQTFELTALPGKIAIQGFGILFLMWNVPYLVALIHPQKNRISLYEAIIMQSIGLGGEFFLFTTLPAEYPILSDAIARFITFDGIGLIALLLAMRITRPGFKKIL